MKKIIYSFLLFIFVGNLFAQRETESVDCVILVDGKLVNSIYGYIIYTDSSQQINRINFGYDIGKISFRKEDKQILDSLPDTTSIMLHLIYVDRYFDKTNREISSDRYEYQQSFRIKSLPSKNDYFAVIFSITNFNKKKGIYYFNYTGDGFIKKWQWKPEYGRKAHKKVYSAYENVSFYEKRYRPRY